MGVRANNGVGDDKLLVGIEVELGLDVGDLVVSERLAVSWSSVLLARSEPDGGLDND